LLIPIGRASVVVLVPVFKPRFARAKRKNAGFAVLLPLAMYDQLQFLTSTEEPPAEVSYTHHRPERLGNNPSYAHGSASAPAAGRFTSSLIPP